MNIDSLAISKLPRPQEFYENWQLVYLTKLQICNHHYFELIRDPASAKILAEIKNDPRVKLLDTHLISHGNGHSIFNAEHLGAWFLWACHKYGLDSAKHNLNKFLDLKKVPIIVTTWVVGIQVEETVELENGVRIVPIENMPDSIDKEKFLMRRMNNFGESYIPQPMTAVTHICEIKKSFSQKESREREKRTIKNDPLMKSHELINKVIILLNAIDSVSCISYWSTGYKNPETPMGMLGGSGGSTIIYDMLGHSSSKLNVSSANEINSILIAYDELPSANQARINRALFRLSQAKRRQQIEDKIIDLCMALEIILLDDNTSSEQLSLTFRMRGSWLIGDNNEQRMLIYTELKNLYRYRSQVVHNGALPKKDFKHSIEIINKCTLLAEKIIRKLIYKPDINWESLVLG